MQENRQNPKLNYFRTYSLPIKLISLIICCFLFFSCVQKDAKQILQFQNQEKLSEAAINVNTASAEELEKLPFVGAKTAQEIIKHREKFGRFRKPAYLMLVRGINDKRFREMKNLVKVE